MPAAGLTEEPLADAERGPGDAARTAERTKYFTHLRTDILAMIPADAETFLSVGCGSGRTEAELIGRGCRVTGIELDPGAAAEAASAGLEIMEGDVNEINARLAGRTFDCLIYADVLEHIADPVAVLGSHVPLLVPGGSAIVSVPNFRHYSVLRQLFVDGHVRYTDAGIFDRTHLRITTRKMIQAWFGEVGLETDLIDYRIWRRREKYLSAAALHLFREFFASQVILRGRTRGGSG